MYIEILPMYSVLPLGSSIILEYSLRIFSIEILSWVLLMSNGKLLLNAQFRISLAQ